MKILTVLLAVAVLKLAGQDVEVTVRQGEMGELALRNISKKDITYFGGVVTAVASDGTEKSIPVAIDFLPTYGHAKYMIDFQPYVPPRTLNAGETYIVDLGQHAASYQKPEARALIYDDKSWWGERAEVESVFRSRKAMSEQYAQLLDAVRDAKAAPNRDRRYVELINTHTGFVSGRLRSYRLAEQPENSYSGRLINMMVRIDEAMKSLYREHSVMGVEIRK